MLVIFDSGYEVNAIYPAFAKKLGLIMQSTNVGTQKIYGIILETYGIGVAAFSMID